MYFTICIFCGVIYLIQCLDFSSMNGKVKKDIEPRILKIAEKLQKLRKAKGYTSYENFAFDNDLPRMQYWRLENGTTNFTITSLLKVLDIHKITLSDFFNDLDC